MNMSPTIHIPGSKSYTNRALLMAALANGTSTLTNVLLSDDTSVMVEALSKLGIEIEKIDTTLRVHGLKKFHKPDSSLYLGNAGTAVRFLTAQLAHEEFDSSIKGDERMNERPIQDLVTALNSFGADIKATNGCPPLNIHGRPLTQNEVIIRGKDSSQYTSALLMLAPRLPDGLTLHVDDDLTSKPYIDMTLHLMNKFCIQGIEREEYSTFKIPAQKYCPQNLTIESDASSASYFFGLAAITGKSITVTPLTRKTLQPDIQILDHLERMGCTVHEENNHITLTGPKQLKPLGPINANAFPDGAMTLAVVAAFAIGETTLTDLHNLRIKESDRLHALQVELTKMGAHVSTTDDSITVHGDPTKLNPAHIFTYNDHRLAMCFGMADVALQQKGVRLEIENPECVNKTYPTFWENLDQATLDT